MITQAQADFLNNLKWPYKYKLCPKPADWTIQEMYSPKEWFIQATFQVGRAAICPRITEPEGRPGFYIVEATYFQTNGMAKTLRSSTAQFELSANIVVKYLKDIYELMNTDKTAYAEAQDDALATVKEMFGPDFNAIVAKTKSNYPIKVMVYMGANKLAHLAEVWVYENKEVQLLVNPIHIPDGRDMELIKELLKYRTLKQRMSEV